MPPNVHRPTNFVMVRFHKKVARLTETSDPDLFAQIVELVGLEDDDNFQPNGFPAFVWPSTYVPMTVTQVFGDRPDYYKAWGLPGHEGIDMRAPVMQEIIAVWDGEVKRVEFHSAYGNSIRLRHLIEFPKNRVVEYESIYAHFAYPSELRVGDRVTQGEVLGLADSTGNSTGSHLHFGVKQFNYPELRPPMEVEYPYDLIDPTVFFEWLGVV
jgi:murein DD-endopeptidase MepM/ murein hydrolase activator NlpD